MLLLLLVARDEPGQPLAPVVLGLRATRPLHLTAAPGRAILVDATPGRPVSLSLAVEGRPA